MKSPLSKAFTKATVCDDTEQLLVEILYFIAAQVPRQFSAAFLDVIIKTLSLIRHNGSKNNFYWDCEKQAPCSDAANSDLSYPSIATGEDRIYVRRRLNRWKERGRNKCTASVPICLSLKVFITLTIAKRLLKTFLQNMSSPSFFTSLLFF